MSLVTADAISVTEYFYVVGDAGNAAPGEPITGLLFSDIETGGSASYVRQGAARVDLTLVTQTVAGAHTDGGFVEVDATNMPGVYRCDFPDAAFIAGVDLVTLQIVIAAANNAVAAPIKLDIVDFATRAQVDALGSGVGGVSNIPATFDNTTRDTIDNAGAVDKGGGLVGIPVTGHAFSAGKEVTIAGTTNYNGVFAIVSQTTNEVVITDTFVSETFGGSETIVSSIKGVIFVGTITSGTFVNTEGKDGTSHEMDDVGDAIDIIYGFDVGGGRTGSFANYLGNLNGNSDQLAFQVYDPVGDAWDTIETILGTGGSSEQAFEPPMLLRHTGTGSELGLIYIRAATLTTSPNSLAINLLQVGAAANALSSGYPDGRIHINTNLSNTNTEPNVDGTATTPVSTMAAVVTLSGLTGLTDVHVVNGSAIVLPGNSDNWSFFGDNWDLDLNGQSIAGAHIQGANVSGAGLAASDCEFRDCKFATASVQPGDFEGCGFGATVTMTLAGDYTFVNPHSLVAGAAGPTWGKTAGQAITAEWRRMSGSVNMTGLEVGDTLTIGGELGTVDLGSPAGAVAVEIRGTYKEITNVGSAVVNTDGAIKGVDVADIFIRTGYAQHAVWIDTVNGAAGTTDDENGIESNPVNSIADANTIATSKGITKFIVASGSSLTFAAAQTGQVFVGEKWTLALGGQNVANSVFVGAVVSGVMAGTGVLQQFRDCIMNATSLIKGTCFYDCQIANTLTVVEAGEFLFKGCVSSVAGAGAPVFDFGAALNSSNLSVRDHSGGWEIANMGAGTGTYNSSFEGHGQIIWAASCSATSNASVRGHWKITDNAGGAVTVTLDDITTDVGSTLVDTNELQGDWADGGRLDALLDLNALEATVAALNDLSAAGVAAELATYDGPTKAEMDAAHALLASDLADILTDTGTSIPALIAALNDLSSAEIAAELATYDGPTKAEMDIAHDLLATEAKQDANDANVLLIKIPTDKMVFTKANELDGNMKSINDATVVGDGNATPWDGA